MFLCVLVSGLNGGEGQGAGITAGSIIALGLCVGYYWLRMQSKSAAKARIALQEQQRAAQSTAKQLQAEAKQQIADTVLPLVDAPAPELHIYRVTPPPTERLSARQATGLIRALLAKFGGGQLQLSLIGTERGLVWQVEQTDTEIVTSADELTDLFNSYYSNVTVNKVAAKKVSKPLKRRYQIFKPAATRYFDRAMSVTDIHSDDPLVHVARALMQVESDEYLTFTISIFAVQVAQQAELERVLTQSAYDAGYRYNPPIVRYSSRDWAETVTDVVGTAVIQKIRNDALRQQRVLAYTESQTNRFMEKLGQPLIGCALSVMIDTPSTERLTGLENTFGAIEELSGTEIKIDREYLSPVLDIQTSQDFHFRQPFDYLTELTPDGPNDPDLLSPYLFWLTFDELAAIWHMPHKGFDSSVLPIGTTQVPISRSAQMEQTGVRIGVNQFGTRSKEVFLPSSERTSHTAVIGKTGRGKSSLLHHMVHQDIADGRGVCVLDPKGDLISSILQHSIPAERERDVLVLDVSHPIDGSFYPPPLNLFVSGIEDDQQFQAAQRLVSLFTLTDTEFAERRMGNTLRQALMAVQAQTNPTVNDVYCLLFDEDYRTRLLPKINNDIVANYWRKFDWMKETEQASITQPLEWRIERFMLNQRLRAMSCHPLRLNFAKLMASNKIVLVSLGDGSDTLPQDELYLLGAALLMQLDYAARRKVVSKPPFMIYIDEAQQFVGTNLPTMLSQLRSYGVGLVLANQFFDQLLGKTFKAVEGNISTLIAFEVGDDDARTLLPYLEPGFTNRALVSLGKYTAAVSMIDGIGKRQPAFTVQTLPPPGHGQDNSAREMELRRKVVKQWQLMPYDEVLKSIQGRYANCGAAAITPTTNQATTNTTPNSGDYREFYN